MSSGTANVSHVPARLHVLLARKARTAIVIRRGPSHHTAVIGWDRKTDRFQVGQWIRARIYERRSDLSPDGKHFLYFARSSKGSWTAISRAPYLKALTLLMKGDCWHGGGLFQSAKEYWLNDGYGHELRWDTAPLSRVDQYPWHERYGGECPGVYFIRLQRDGWEKQSTSPDGTRGKIFLFEKRVNGHWRLHKRAHGTLSPPVGRGCYFDTHELLNTRTGEAVPCPHWEWADVDGGRLVWAAGGKLHAGHLGAGGLSGEAELYDFNPMRFEALEAPY